jgi:hypothetical protein
VNHGFRRRVVAIRGLCDDGLSRSHRGAAEQGVGAMPLSEDEQRILNQIEQQFYESDPAFAQQVSQTTLYRHAFGRVKWGILGLLAGLVFLIATLQVSVLLSLLGFGFMLLSAFVIERNVRAMGKVGMEQMTANLRTHRLGGAGSRLRDRFKHEE